MWSLKHKSCIGCGTTEIKHIGRGLCLDCYNKYLNKKHKGRRKWVVQSRIKNEILTKKYLLEEHLKKGRTLSEIADECGCLAEDVYEKIITYKVYSRFGGQRALNEDLN